MKYQSDVRITYSELKLLALGAYFDFCRDSGLVRRLAHDQVMARVVYTFEFGFERPLEDVMWNLIVLVLSGGWDLDFEARQRELILRNLRDNDLATMLANVPSDEIDQFVHDLSALNLAVCGR